ncbi:MAG: hypothetical protein JJE52_14540 [Acidimicrobiia bacterium]|nr:hypothetical protein [Acidimicrobiia bacterium]
MFMLLSQRPLTAADSDVALTLTSRNDLAERIATNVRRERNTLVLGPRGAGRTSVLALVERILRKSAAHIVLRADTGAWNSSEDVLAAILALLGSDPRGPTTRTVTWQERFGIGSALRDIEVTDPAPVNEADTARIARIAQKALQDAKKDRIVILLDNLHPQAGHDLFGRFRDSLWAAPITWVATGDGDKTGYLDPPADVFWERVEWLEPLTREEASELINRRADAAGEDDPDVASVRPALDAIIELLDDPSPRDVVRAAANVADNGSVVGVASNQVRLEKAAAHGGRRAAMLLAELDNLDRPVHAGDEELMSRMGLTRPRLVQLLGALVQAELLEKRREGRRVLYVRTAQ